MVYMQLIMQGQGMVSVAPIISDTFDHDQCINSELVRRAAMDKPACRRPKERLVLGLCSQQQQYVDPASLGPEARE